MWPIDRPVVWCGVLWPTEPLMRPDFILWTMTRQRTWQNDRSQLMAGPNVGLRPRADCSQQGQFGPGYVYFNLAKWQVATGAAGNVAN